MGRVSSSPTHASVTASPARVRTANDRLMGVRVRAVHLHLGRDHPMAEEIRLADFPMRSMNG